MEKKGWGLRHIIQKSILFSFELFLMKFTDEKKHKNTERLQVFRIRGRFYVKEKEHADEASTWLRGYNFVVYGSFWRGALLARSDSWLLGTTKDSSATGVRNGRKPRERIIDY